MSGIGSRLCWLALGRRWNCEVSREYNHTYRWTQAFHFGFCLKAARQNLERKAWVQGYIILHFPITCRRWHDKLHPNTHAQTLPTSHEEKWSGEPSQITRAFNQNVVGTNDIARLLIIKMFELTLAKKAHKEIWLGSPDHILLPFPFPSWLVLPLPYSW